MSKTNVLKALGVTASAILLIGATGCNKQETASPATDVNTAPETVQTTSIPIPIAQTGTQVIVNDAGFQPKRVTIKVGDSVTWTNSTSKNVRVASDPHPLHNGLAGFDDVSGATPGDIYTYLFSKKGTFSYHDHNDSSVKGTVVVTE